MNETIPQALAEAVRRDPTTPLLTGYDDATHDRPSDRPTATLDRTEDRPSDRPTATLDRTEDRAELSGATLDNWVSKTANLLIDGAGLDHGDTVAVLLPPHWQTAAIMLGASAAGLALNLGGDPRSVAALFTTPDRITEADAWPSPERYLTGLLPLAMPLREVPAGHADFPAEVRNHGDHFRPVRPATPDDLAIAEPEQLSHLAAIRTAMRRAGELGIAAGDRVLVDTRAHPDPMDWLLAPLVAGASIVLCANQDPARLAARIAAEKVTVVLAGESRPAS